MGRARGTAKHVKEMEGTLSTPRIAPRLMATCVQASRERVNAGYLYD